MVESYILASGQHFRLPIKIHQTLFDDKNLKPVHRELYIRLLMKLEAYNNANNFCQNYYPCTIEKICTWYNQSAKTVREHVHHLTNNGYLQEEGVTKLNKNRPILIGVRFVTDKFFSKGIEKSIENPPKEEQEPLKSQDINPKPAVQKVNSSIGQGSNNNVENLTKAQILKKQMDELNNKQKSTPVNIKRTPQVNKTVLPKSTKKDHNNQIKDQIDLISSFEKIDLIKNLHQRDDKKKITLPQFDKILQRFIERGISLAKDVLFKVLCQMQFDMNKTTWKTSNTTHRLNGIMKAIGNDINNYKVWVEA